MEDKLPLFTLEMEGGTKRGGEKYALKMERQACRCGDKQANDNERN